MDTNSRRTPGMVRLYHLLEITRETSTDINEASVQSNAETAKLLSILHFVKGIQLWPKHRPSCLVNLRNAYSKLRDAESNSAWMFGRLRSII